MLQAKHLPISKDRAIVRVGEIPFLFWALQPLTRLPFQTAAIVWMSAMWVLSAIGILGTLRYLAWRHFALPTLMFLTMPQVIDEVYYANDVGLILGALGCALAVLGKRPMLAGALLAATWIKPQVALPIVLLVLLFHPQSRYRLAGGFVIGSAVLFLLPGFGAGWGVYSMWFHGLTVWSRDLGSQGNIASLAGLYLRWASASLRFALGAGLLALAAVLTAAGWWRFRRAAAAPLAVVAFLWVVWFLATPYAHFYDEPLLALPVLVMVGVNSRRLVRPIAIVVLYAFFFSVFFVGSTSSVMLHCLPVIGLALALGWAIRGVRGSGVKDAVIQPGAPAVS